MVPQGGYTSNIEGGGGVYLLQTQDNFESKLKAILRSTSPIS